MNGNEQQLRIEIENLHIEIQRLEKENRKLEAQVKIHINAPKSIPPEVTDALMKVAESAYKQTTHGSSNADS